MGAKIIQLGVRRVDQFQETLSKPAASFPSILGLPFERINPQSGVIHRHIDTAVPPYQLYLQVDMQRNTFFVFGKGIYLAEKNGARAAFDVFSDTLEDIANSYRMIRDSLPLRAAEYCHAAGLNPLGYVAISSQHFAECVSIDDVNHERYFPTKIVADPREFSTVS